MFGGSELFDSSLLAGYVFAFSAQAKLLGSLGKFLEAFERFWESVVEAPTGAVGGELVAV